MLTLIKQRAKLAHVNPRAEKNGEDNVLAADIKIELNAPNSVLDAFDKSLRKLLFRKAQTGEQSSLPLEDNDGLTGLRFPQLAPLRWDEDFPGYAMRLETGLGLPQTGITIDDVELKKFSIEPVEGGSVKLTFNLACHPDAETIGALCDLMQDVVELTLRPPAAVQL